MNPKHLWWIIPLMVIAGFSLAIFGTTQYHNSLVPIEQQKSEMSHYWSCMDGCSNMLEIIYDNKVSDKKDLHDMCAHRCCTQYMITLGCTNDNRASVCANSTMCSI